MSSDPTVPPEGPEEPSEPGIAMPPWVPIAIGLVLVGMAALAVYTGLTVRPNTLARIIKSRHVQMSAGAGAPGEQQAGASRMYSGESGENIPLANPPVQGLSRAEITSGRGGVAATVRMWARRGLLTDVQPPDAMVYLNGVPMGQANQFNTADEVYDFPAAGSYTIRLVAPGYREQQYVVTVSDSATQEIAKITARLEKE
jgi:hypothetical protein